MNQEKIMKARMITAYVISIFAVAALCIFIALFIDEKGKTRRTYKLQYMKNLESACREIESYQNTGKDYDLHYSMILSDIGSARTLVFLIDDYSEERQKTINEFHYCLVKYPEQMSEKLDDALIAMSDITDNLDKGYEELDKLLQPIDKLGS